MRTVGGKARALLVICLLVALVSYLGIGEWQPAPVWPEVGPNYLIDLGALVEYRLASLREALEGSGITDTVDRIRAAVLERDYFEVFTRVSLLANLITFAMRSGALSATKADMLRLRLFLAGSAIAMLFDLESGHQQPLWLCLGEYRKGLMADPEEIITIWPQMNSAPFCNPAVSYPDGEFLHAKCECFDARVPIVTPQP